MVKSQISACAALALLTIGCVALAVGCTAPRVDAGRQGHSRHGHPGQTPSLQPSEGTATDCELLFRAHLVADGPQTKKLFATVENVGPTTLELELPDRCPAGAIDFEGLGSSYDYYRTCNAGACPGTRPPSRFVLPPGATTELAATVVYLRGAPPCTASLAPGRYRIVPVPPAFGGVATCVVGTLLEVEDPPPPTPPVQPIVEPSPAPSKRDLADPYACERPQDCVLSCPRTPGCCGWPCGCRHAIHRDHKADFEARYAADCEKAPNCPAVACMHDPAHGATCHAGRCVGVSTPFGNF